MIDIDPTDGLYAAIMFVPQHWQGLVERKWIAPHWRGVIETAFQTTLANSYRLQDEGIEPIEVTAATEDECLKLLLAAAAARGWTSDRIEMSHTEDTIAHYHDGRFCLPEDDARIPWTD